jgi:general secretion pathway protein C
VQADVIKIIKNNPWVPRILCVIFILFIFLELLFGLRSLISSDAVDPGIPNPETKEKISVPLDRANVVSASLFGGYTPTDLEDADVKESALHLSVIGIIFSAQQEQSEVIIKLPDNQERIFHVDDDLPGGAKIKQIQPDEIFVIRHGAIESLSLPEKGLTFDPPAPPL